MQLKLETVIEEVSIECHKTKTKPVIGYSANCKPKESQNQNKS